MKLAAVVIGILSASMVMDARAQPGIPSQATIADMGLSGMQILSDREASTIRVCAVPPSRWGDLYYYVRGVSRLEKEVRQSSPRPVIRTLGVRVMVRH